MPTIYQRRERIPELKGRVRGGLSVVVHSPAEVAGLERLVETAAVLPGDTMENLYRVLANAGGSLDMWPDIRATPAGGSRSGNDFDRAEPIDARVQALRQSLALSARMWTAQGNDIGELALALVIPRPGRRAVLEIGRPAFVLDYGSVRARVLAAGGRLREFGVALFPVSRSKRKANVVEALRDQATGVRLPRLESLQPSGLTDKTGVVIFLHGLMSTDVGTFDELVNTLKAPPGLASSILLTAWPHDTLESIESNADDLAVLIERTLGPSSLPIAFVCHSRGGLVARRTAVELMEINREQWRSRLRGCVTFGTPHEGAELAESGDELIGKLLLMRTVATQAGLVPLVDALWAVKGRRKLEGISDLRPRSNGGGFLRSLRKAEGRIARKAGAVPLRLYAIGGNARADGFSGMLSRRYFGGAAHDMVVPLASAIPAASEQGGETTCNHFGYFTSEEVGREPATGAVAFLRAALAVSPPEAETRPHAQASQPLPAPPERRFKLKLDPAKVAAHSGATTR